ncbi:MAG: RNA-binding S4 domain-containing protein [Synechococcaceae cyanobacterium]|nr:RNA-binding S4 domain-containing protein [Synechococcaceae cyanobacterium]
MKLDQFLKWRGLVATGGEAKLRIQQGDVQVDGRVETRRGRQLLGGERVSLDGREHRVPTAAGEGPVTP